MIVPACASAADTNAGVATAATTAVDVGGACRLSVVDKLMVVCGASSSSF